MRTIGRNTQGVRLIKLDEGDAVSSLAKLPEDELGDVEAAELEATGNGRPIIDDDATAPLDDLHEPHIMDDGVGEAEASDHIDLDGDDDDTGSQDDLPSAQV
jgi:DNA gyrase subunit A